MTTHRHTESSEWTVKKITSSLEPEKLFSFLSAPPPPPHHHPLLLLLLFIIIVVDCVVCSWLVLIKRPRNKISPWLDRYQKETFLHLFCLFPYRRGTTWVWNLSRTAVMSDWSWLGDVTGRWRFCRGADWRGWTCFPQQAVFTQSDGCVIVTGNIHLLEVTSAVWQCGPFQLGLPMNFNNPTIEQ